METSITADQARITVGSFTKRYVVVNNVAGIGSTLPTFTLPAALNPVEADPVHMLAVYRNGILQANGGDYTYDSPSKTITFIGASIPQTGDVVQFEVYE